MFPDHSVGRGPNRGEPTLLNFNTRLIEASAVYFHYETKYNTLRVYYNSKTDSARLTLFEVRRNNKNTTFIYNDRNREENSGWFLRDLKTAGGNKDVYATETVIELLKNQGYSIVTQFDYTDTISFEMPHHSGNHISPSYVKDVKNGIEIGWISNGTYNSIPQVLKIEKVTGIKTQSLRDLGIEKNGYYDGHYKCEILPSQAKAAKQFFSKRFKK